MAGVWILIMMAVLALAAFVGFALPARVRSRFGGGSGDDTAPDYSSRRPGVAVEVREPLHLPDGLRDTAMMLELMASMLDAGAGIGRALELIARCAAPPISQSLRPVVAALAIGVDWETAWRAPTKHATEVVRLKDALAFAALTGAPSAAILYAQAARERREQFRAAEKRAAALGVKLVVPLGLCSLPAFICLGIVPVLIAMLPSG
ncbi:type II secretion system F family protein [Paenarthrobacter nitroguajacolicus]|uniref:Type II secretion system F family protein n=1 Tax=Paenarthrobacter nitroguajacolicus TaxID=211146 RepID=A0A558GNZ7_PAENT|nr:type II secretion system F family protein [Paenarthrobacter nitroguajacolicus]TVU58610.1 type II secretion system F family protein [Paenarthrobacter nitroguajacolicus]